MKSNKTILITGTHHTPAIELIHQLKLDPLTNWHIEYIGHIYPTETHILHTIIPKLKIDFHNLEGGKFDRRWLPYTIMGIPRTVKAVFIAVKLVKSINPDIVVSFGGYISVPVIFASWICRKPSITHEQTSVLSLSTKINSLFVNKIALSFAVSDDNPKNVVTGNLIRRQVFNNASKKFAHLSAIVQKYPLIYITGGNQGSSFFNNLFPDIIKTLTQKYTIIHQVGNLEYQRISKTNTNKRYIPIDYVNLGDIGWVLNHSSIIISRAGGNICQEIVALNKPSILIPLPVSQQDEQLLNAKWVQSNIANHTIISPQKDTTPKLIADTITLLMNKSRLMAKLTTKTNHNLLTLIHEIV